MTMHMGIPTFTTRRLNVFKVTLTPTGLNTERMVFLGFYKDSEQPTIIVNAVVNYPVAPNEVLTEGFPAYVDWIETAEGHRRQGIAEELWRGMVAHLGYDLDSSSASEAGEALLNKLFGAAT